ncbi:piggyBac transposable element-derived protein 4-like [Lineus longissimus]|uniref:piggyBac transposable element-derived protein 4-like n=1 Tax=Lineus longissimus TaxID=88925 RepID=UPI00315DFF52
MANVDFGGQDFDASGDDSDGDNDAVAPRNNFLNANVRVDPFAGLGDLFLDSDDEEDEDFFGFPGNVGDVPDLNWRNRLKPIDRVNFEETPGPTIQNPPGNGLAIDYFQLFFDDAFLDKIRILTNLNASRKKHRDPDANKSAWKEIESTAELKAFFGMLLFIEKYLDCRIESVWDNERDNFMMSFPGLSLIMGRRRFTQILRYLHFCDEDKARDQDQTADKLYKLKPLLLHLKKAFMDNFVPEREMAIDECMVPFKGRLGMKQYMKDKPVKWGIKVWMLAESKTGYNYNFEVYVGRNMNNDAYPNVGLGETVCLSLTEPISQKGYHIYIDRFYTSPALMYHTLQRELYFCGTVQPNRRQFPDVLKKTKPQATRMARGDLLVESGCSYWDGCDNLEGQSGGVLLVDNS